MFLYHFISITLVMLTGEVPRFIRVINHYFSYIYCWRKFLMGGKNFGSILEKPVEEHVVIMWKMTEDNFPVPVPCRNFKKAYLATCCHYSAKIV